MGIQLCTRGYTIVYTWVHHSVHACTHSPPRQEVYTGEPEASGKEVSISRLYPAHTLSVAPTLSLYPAHPLSVVSRLSLP